MTRLLSRRAAIAVFMTAKAFAKAPVAETNASGGIAIKGYDPVAYFDAGEAIKGSKEHSYDWKGAKWRFFSRENLAKFQAEPGKFAPQFGGYCSWAVSENYTADIDPQAWTVRNGRLYLNYSKQVQKMWLADVDGRIAAAERNWPGLHR